jgi:hypothetical protein
MNSTMNNNNRNRNNNNNAMRGAKGRRGRLRRTANGRLQNFAGVSHRDTVPQVRKFTSVTTCTLLNSTSEQSFGVSSLSVIPTANSSIGRCIGSYVGTYEEYRIRRIRARATCGRGYTNDRRIKTIMLSRVDTNYLDSVDTWENVQAIIQSENCITKTFTERGNALIADYRPIQFSSSYPKAVPTLYSANQWYRTQDYADHTWRGGVVALILSETGIQPNQVSINITLECDVEFRGRVQDSTTFVGSRLFVEQRPVDEIEGRQELPSKNGTDGVEM